MGKSNARTYGVNGPVVKAKGMAEFQVREMVMVGEKGFLGKWFLWIKTQESSRYTKKQKALEPVKS